MEDKEIGCVVRSGFFAGVAYTHYLYGTTRHIHDIPRIISYPMGGIGVASLAFASYLMLGGPPNFHNEKSSSGAYIFVITVCLATGSYYVIQSLKN